MRLGESEDEISEVTIVGDKDPLLSVCHGQHRVIGQPSRSLTSNPVAS